MFRHLPDRSCLPCLVCPGVSCAGTIIEVNVSELGLVTPAGKVVWGKYAQVRRRDTGGNWQANATSSVGGIHHRGDASVC